MLTQLARHSPEDGIDEQEGPFHQEGLLQSSLSLLKGPAHGMRNEVNG
ncbi:MAG: hypothetical protein ACJ8CB_23820 [Ktedonobacteraceae bacterium]